VKASYSLDKEKRKATIMKTLSALIVGGALTLGTAMAQNAPKPATPAAPATQTNVKKHRKHHKTGTTAATATPAAPSTAAPAAAKK
jgi:hypothetical protein